jgi:hypothetical protein
MKFLVETNKEGEVVHDFTFTLLKAVEYHNWRGNLMCCILQDNYKLDEVYLEDTIPVGSVEFVAGFLKQYYGISPKPLNVPEELISQKYTQRIIKNVHHDVLQAEIMDLIKSTNKQVFVKSCEFIKPKEGPQVVDNTGKMEFVANGKHQISSFIDIDSEWRAFVFKGKLVGLQNYSGDFTMFPDVLAINDMIRVFESAPVAYTLDVGINKYGTFVIECHDFFSCGLYGFAKLNILPAMYSQWFNQCLLKNNKYAPNR